MPRSKNGALLSLRNRGNTIVSSVLLVGLLGVVATVLVEDQFVVPADVKVAQVAATAAIEQNISGNKYEFDNTATVCTANSPSGQKVGNQIKKVGKFCSPKVTNTVGDDLNVTYGVDSQCQAKDGIPAGICWTRVCDPSNPTKCTVIQKPGILITNPDTLPKSSAAYETFVSYFAPDELNVYDDGVVSDKTLSDALNCAYSGCASGPANPTSADIFSPPLGPLSQFDPNREVADSTKFIPPPDVPTGSVFNYAQCAEDPTLPQCKDARWGFEQLSTDYCKSNPTAPGCQPPNVPPPQVPPPQVPPPQVPPPQEPPPQNQNNQNPFGNFAQMLGQLLGKALTGNNCPAGQAPSPYPQQQQYVYQQNAFGQVVAVPVQQQQNTGFFGNIGNLFGGGSSNCTPQPGTAGGGTQQPQLPVQAQLSCSPKKAGVGSKIALTFACVNAQQGTGVGFSTGGALSGSTEVTIATSTLDADGNSKTYELSCTGTAGIQRATCEVGVVVNPAIVLAAIPKEVKSGETSSIGWLATGMSACKVSSPQLLEFTTANENISLTEGIAKTTAISTTTDVFLKCTTLGGAAKESKVTITVKN